ncbi:hypothetical protein BZG36_00970 [Bifiguratus adelaidae]|uniref:Major facilitator superfamily (MFS) profile domain-containing protein n=1 Tax=Bifiguratus adelaidae TaxID=1938954 RepID=A0A261Y6F8_9FUNG|nr:hypothetical protein BZG36_00970 [Bifiguratus adelaidae]
MAKMSFFRLSGDSLIQAITIYAGIGVLLFGYDQGVMGGLITGPPFNEQFGYPSAIVISTIVAVFEVGALVGSVISGRTADSRGRLGSIHIGSIILIIGAALQAGALGNPTVSIVMMIGGRLIAGAGCGFLMTSIPVYQSEIASAEHRGRQQCIQWVLNIFGVVLAYWLDYLLSHVQNDMSWRVPIAVQIIFAVILFIGTYIFPESPRWLISKGRLQDGKRVLYQTIGQCDEQSELVELEFRDIEKTMELENSYGDSTWKEMFQTSGLNQRHRTLLAMGIQAMQQLCGINAVAYYQVFIYLQAGITNQTALLIAGVNTLVYNLSTFVPVFFIDRWGRKPLLIGGAFLQSLAMCMVAGSLASETKSGAAFVATGVIIYTAAFGSSWLPIPWMYPAEIFPQRTRAKGAALATLSNFLFNTLIGVSVPPLQNSIGYRLYLCFAIINAVMILVVHFCYVETKGRSLEEMTLIFSGASAGEIERVQQILEQAEDPIAVRFEIERKLAQFGDIGEILETEQLLGATTSANQEDNRSVNSYGSLYES